MRARARCWWAKPRMPCTHWPVQGLNLGLLDCAVLAEVLGDDLRGLGGPVRFGEHKLLRRYERRRKSENLLAANGGLTAWSGCSRATIRCWQACASRDWKR